ncbi:MAG: helix-turn-helix transcriptional regulator [Euryarchaeota archaeon]|nr:helix-turn-helix transcriptional regulator [Euryarchaeota archaeon]
MPQGVPGGWGRGRGFMGSYLPLIILKLIKEKGSVHGYEIMKIVENLFETSVPPGMVYMYLRRMEHRGLVMSEWDTSSSPPRRIYKITPLGESYFSSVAQYLKVLKKVLDYICEEC